jgi:hypothetical protein
MKISRVVLVFFITCTMLSLSTLQVTADRQLVSNPGFEMQLSGWSVSSGTATYAVDASTHHDDTYSAKGIELEQGSLGRLYQDVSSLVRAGRKYKICGWIKTQDVVGYAVIALDYVASNGWTPADGYVKEIGYVSGTHDWAYYESNEFILPLKPEDASTVWFLFDFNAGKGTAWWDDVSLIEIGVSAHVDVDPQTLNLRSQGKWITAYVELPSDYDIASVNVSTIMLNETIPAEPKHRAIEDYDSDNVKELMLKFDRDDLISYILANTNMATLSKDRFMTTTLTITGNLKNGKLFQGSDTIKIVFAVLRSH